MFEIYIWIISFVSLYISIFWIIISSRLEKNQSNELKEFPFVTVAVPAWNEEETIINTVKSLIQLDYPKDKIEIIVVDDGSKDDTSKILKNFLKKEKISYVKVIKQNNTGKAGALNTALKIAKGDYFGVFDADSLASEKSLKLMLPYFSNEKIGAVISPIKVLNPRNTIEKIQRLEYIFSSFIRKLMSNVNTLHITHGVLSLFRTGVIRKLGGFDSKFNRNLTEDFEIALRLRKNDYQILLCEENVNYTKVPNNLKSLWFQRVRWFRGFMVNTLRYKGMVMRKRYGLLGRFQLPLELLTVCVVFISAGFMGYQVIIRLYNFFIKLSILKIHFFDLFKIPTIKQVVLEINFKLFFSFFVVLIAGIYLYIIAHRYVDEKWRFHLVSFIYLFLYPIIRSLQWVHAFILEVLGAKERWR